MVGWGAIRGTRHLAAVYQKDVQKTILVVIKKACARTHRFYQVLFRAGRVGMVKTYSNRGRHVLEKVTRQEVAGERAPAVVDADALEAIQLHLSIVADASSLQEDLEASTDALLTVLSGGYELEVRIQVVRRLLRRADVRYESLLVEHLRDIRDHAMDLENEAVAKEAKQLLRRLAE